VQFWEDLALVWSNAMAFNEPSSIVHRKARTMQRFSAQLEAALARKYS